MAQKFFLLAAGLFFYAFADLRFVPFLLYIIAVSFFGGIFCRNKAMFAAFVAADLLPLLFFKYGASHWFFPLGLSFFTFPSVGYVADVWTKKIEAKKNPLDLALFISFFPTISSGPIQRAANLIPQFQKVHRFDSGWAADGMKLFAWGMFKKLVVADRAALYVNYVYGNVADQHGLALLFATLLYSFQIYCDFSGYSDMAIGAARFLGFDAGKNFDRPYLSRTVGEFWRRWHISLSSWLRDYVYIPLGGSRVALPRIYLNLMITFLASGVWHGSTWNFVIWGGLHGLYLCAERATKKIRERAKIPAWVDVAVTFCLAAFAWIFFRAKNLGDAFLAIQKFLEIPGEAPAFFACAKSQSAKDALHVYFSMVNDAGDATRGMAKTLFFLTVFVAVQLATRKSGGLAFLKARRPFVRWILYFAFTALLLEGIFASFKIDSSFSTNFIYQNF